MPLPSFKNRPLADARRSRIAAAKATQLSEKAQKLLRDAKLLRDVDGDDAGADALEAQAETFTNQAQDQTKAANDLHKKATSQANFQAALTTPINAAGTYVKQQVETFKALANPANRLQNLFAAVTPFTGAFSRAKSGLLGDSQETQGPAVFVKVARQLDETNSTLMAIARYQPKLLAGAGETTKRVQLVEGVARETADETKFVIHNLEDIKQILNRPARDQGGYGQSFPDFGIAPVSGDVVPASNVPLDLKNITPSGPSKIMQEQLEILKAILQTNREELAEAKEDDPTKRLRSAESADETRSNMNGDADRESMINPENPNDGKPGNMGWLTGLLEAAGAGLSAIIGTKLLPLITPLVRGLGGILERIGLGGIGRGLSGFGAAAAEGGGAIAAEAGAAGAAAVGRTAGRGALSLGGRLIAGLGARVGLGEAAAGVAEFIPGVGNILLGGLEAKASYDHFSRGDWKGGLAHAGAGAVGLTTGAVGGILASTAANAYDMYRDMNHETPNQVRANRMQQHAQEQARIAQNTQRQAPPQVTVQVPPPTVINGGGGNQSVTVNNGRSIVEVSRQDYFSYASSPYRI